jgi:hypothetical protein
MGCIELQLAMHFIPLCEEYYNGYNQEAHREQAITTQYEANAI